MKKGVSYEQVYEATTVNSSSYISKYFSWVFEDISKEINEKANHQVEIQEMEEFLIKHASSLEPRRHKRTSIIDNSHSKSKDASNRKSI